MRNLDWLAFALCQKPFDGWVELVRLLTKIPNELVRLLTKISNELVRLLTKISNGLVRLLTQMSNEQYDKR